MLPGQDARQRGSACLPSSATAVPTQKEGQAGMSPRRWFGMQHRATKGSSEVWGLWGKASAWAAQGLWWEARMEGPEEEAQGSAPALHCQRAAGAWEPAAGP